MRALVTGLSMVHGLIHVAGFVKAFGLADLASLSGPVSHAAGVGWLVAAIALGLTAWARWAERDAFWVVGLVAVAVSQTMIVTAWGDAWAGTFPNVVILAAVVYGFAARGPWSFSARHRAAVASRPAPAEAPPALTEADLAGLPEPVATHIRRSGAVGRPRVWGFAARLRGRIRRLPADAWMPFEAEQRNDVRDGSRFFLLDARRSGVPVDVYHAFADGSATMRVRLLSLVPVADARGPEMDRSETVTLFNDLCLFAPAGLVDADVRWVTDEGGGGGDEGVGEAAGTRRVVGDFTAGVHTVRATLVFDDAGDLVDFVSDDRLAASEDGRSFTPMRWSTPVRGHRVHGGYRAFARGEGRWHAPAGSFAYLELELLELRVNPDHP